MIIIVDNQSDPLFNKEVQFLILNFIRFYLRLSDYVKIDFISHIVYQIPRGSEMQI